MLLTPAALCYVGSSQAGQWVYVTQRDFPHFGGPAERVRLRVRSIMHQAKITPQQTRRIAAAEVRGGRAPSACRSACARARPPARQRPSGAATSGNARGVSMFELLRRRSHYLAPSHDVIEKPTPVLQVGGVPRAPSTRRLYGSLRPSRVKCTLRALDGLRAPLRAASCGRSGRCGVGTAKSRSQALELA